MRKRLAHAWTGIVLGTIALATLVPAMVVPAAGVVRADLDTLGTGGRTPAVFGPAGVGDATTRLSHETATAPPATGAGAGAMAPKGVNWNNIDELWKRHQWYDWKGIAGDLADMNAARISWARVGLTYGPPLAFYDRLVALARAHHVKLLFVIHKGPPHTDVGTPVQLAETARWLALAVRRFKSYVTAWECHNEPNLPAFWNIQPLGPAAAYNYSVHNYVVYLRTCYRTIKAQDPTATVLLGGISAEGAERFLGQLMVQKAYLYCDAVALHPYAGNPDAVVGLVRRLRDIMKANPRMSAKPVWITEVGFQHESAWSNLPGYVQSEQQKAAYLAQTMVKLAQAGITTPIFWYTLHEGPNQNGFGLVRKGAGGTPTTYLPAYYAYQGLWARAGQPPSRP